MKDMEEGQVGTANGGAAPGYRDLVAWQNAMSLVTAIYEETRDWPKEEMYGLTAQLRRAAVSITSKYR